MTHAVTHVLREFIHILEKRLTVNLPTVYPALIEQLRIILRFLEGSKDLSSEKD